MFARIYRPSKTAMQSGRAKTKDWVLEFEPADARYLMNHTGHCLALKPEEERFITAELIRQTTFTGVEQDIRQRIEAT